MAITKAEALASQHGDILHAPMRDRACAGPRGPKRWRVSGRCAIWVRRPADFRLPIKFGLYVSDAVTEGDAHLFHWEKDCPALEENRKDALAEIKEILGV